MNIIHPLIPNIRQAQAFFYVSLVHIFNTFELDNTPMEVDILPHPHYR